MTDGILSSEAMERMAPEFASTGLLSLVGDTAPTRAILCAGAGHFALANITLTQGGHIGGGVTAAEQLVERWGLVSDRAGELVPEHGLIQVERELVSARGDVTSSVER